MKTITTLICGFVLLYLFALYRPQVVGYLQQVRAKFYPKHYLWVTNLYVTNVFMTNLSTDGRWTITNNVP